MVNETCYMGDFVCKNCGTSYGHMTSCKSEKCPKCGSLEKLV